MGKKMGVKPPTVSGHIGEDYLDWKPGSSIIIPSYVGSGKTQFVFDKLVNNLNGNEKLIYFCNRSILKDQVIRKNRKAIDTDGEESKKNKIAPEQECYQYNENVYILTYQFCENKGQFPDIRINRSVLFPQEKQSGDETIEIKQSEVKYFVFDEAHYFATDISFNDNCAFWSKKHLVFNNSISVFLTATPEPLYCFLAMTQTAFEENDIVAEINVRNDAKKLINYYSSKLGEKPKRNPAVAQEPVANSKGTDVLEKNCRAAKRAYRLEDFGEYMRLMTLSETILNEIGIDPHKSTEYMLEDEFFKYWEPFFENKKEDFKVYFAVVNYISNLIEKYHSEHEGYMLTRAYDNYSCRYFENYEDLYDLILNSEDRWIIFVDSETDGNKIEGGINALCEYAYQTLNMKSLINYSPPYAVFLSRDTIKKKRSSAYREYKNIVEKEQFDCKVLITTSLLDCGVNIGSEIGSCNVNHVVLAQTSKTEFIQMLGRVRTIDHQKVDGFSKDVTLYIKSVDVKTINDRSEKRIKDLAMATRFKNLKMRQKLDGSNLGIFKDIVKSYRSNRLSPIIKIKKGPDLNLNSDESIIKHLYLDMSYFAYCLYDIYQYYGFILKHKKKEDKTEYSGYLSERLSWLGKEYESKNWVMVEERKKEIITKLEEYVGKKRSCNRNDQLALKAYIVERLLRFPNILLPADFAKRKKEVSRSLKNYKNSCIRNKIDDKYPIKGTIIKAETLSDILGKMDIPYLIKTEKVNTKNWWWVEEAKTGKG